jgi:protease-4
MTEPPAAERYNGPSPQTIRIECAPAETKKKSFLAKAAGRLIVVLLIVSVIVNVYFWFILSTLFEGPFSATVVQEGKEDQTVAIYSIDGIIDPEQSFRMEQFTRFVRETPEIKAVLLRVASPGGTINDSEKVYQQVLRIKNTLNKPVAVYMDGVAASGGYYISAPADKIFARKTTITGSIGVIAMYPALKGLAEKLGVELVTVRSRQSTTFKAKPSGYEVPEDRIMRDIQSMLDTHQEQFNAVVTAHREIRKNPVQREIVNAAGEKETITEIEPFNGQVYLAGEAKELNLIDEVGQMEDAWDFLASEAHLDKPRIVRYSVRPTLAQALGIPFASVKVDENFFEDITSLRILMMWKVN